MCGIVGILSQEDSSQLIYDALTVLQHRGQEAAGIVTLDEQQSFCCRHGYGLARDVFSNTHLQSLRGKIGLGYVRHPWSREAEGQDIQPLYIHTPIGVSLTYNGNLTNAHQLRSKLVEPFHTSYDSEVLLNVFAGELAAFSHKKLSVDELFSAITATYQQINGAYAVVAMVAEHGLVAFRDPFGIRPLVLGKRILADGRKEYLVASESVAIDMLEFQFLRDVAPGEAIYITTEGELYSRQCVVASQNYPCLFEYLYFARPDSFIDKISVYNSRVRMGVKLGERIAEKWEDYDIDVVIPIPESSCDMALEIARVLNKPYRRGLVKNWYLGRPFFPSGPFIHGQKVRRQVNINRAEFRNKRVLLVDDSIVRGTISAQIVALAREAGASKVYLASVAPAIRFPNVYGIELPAAHQLIARGRDIDEIAKMIGVDDLIFQELSDLVDAVREDNPDIQQFECSVFNGDYITRDVSQAYLDYLESRHCRTVSAPLPDPVQDDIEEQALD